jgi:hypothetical protein
MSEEVDLIRKVVGVLEEMGVPHMVGGGVALSAWATPRTTHDLDIVVNLPEERIDEFCSYFPADRYYIDADDMRTAFKHRDQLSLGMYSFVDMESYLKVDLFPLRSDDPAQQAALSRRVTTEILQGLPASVYAPDDLLVQKLRWYAASGSERQFRDCLNLALTDLKRPSPLIHWDYVEDWATQLGPQVQQAWETVKAAIGQARLNE